MADCANNKKSKILLLMTILVQKSLPLMVFRKLVEKGFDVHVSYYYDATGVYTPDFAEDFAARGRLHDLRPIHQSLYFNRIADIIADNNIEVIVQNGCEPAYPLIPQLKLRFPHLKVVDILYNKIGHTVSHFLYENAIDRVIVESRFMKDYILESTLKKDKQVFINENGVDLEYLKSLPCERQSESEFVIGYIGRMSPEKNPLGFVTLSESLSAIIPNLKFKMFGDGIQTAEVLKRISESSYRKRFKVGGFVGDVRDALRAVDVVVVPSIFDGRPNIVMEANASGVPVFGAPVGAIPEMIIDGENGFLIDPKNSRVIGEILQSWISDAALYKEARQKSRASAVKRFSNDKMFDRYADAVACFMT
ncbi:group 1 glycosyl transferase [Ochrobactrum sp. CDB2]|nr:group 1 glycosyl transferase [Ochrobactrum sp. CDB2]